MKRWMVLLIVFVLMGGMIVMSGCNWDDVDSFLGSTHGCGCFWDCTKVCTTTAGEYSCEMTDAEGNCVDPFTVCTYNGCQFFFDCVCNYQEQESSDK